MPPILKCLMTIIIGITVPLRVLLVTNLVSLNCNKIKAQKLAEY